MTNFRRMARFGDATTTTTTTDAPSVWKILDDLAAAREVFELRAATLNVLRALCSFLPQATREGRAGSTIVWPSNATLAERACGMPERSLRRHLGNLIEAGLILRKSSTNGKRFALRIGEAVVTAYGFDLAPLLQRREEIGQAVETLRSEAEIRQLLRCEIRMALHAETDVPSHLRIIATEALRRKISLRELQDIHTQMQGLARSAGEMAGTAGQNGRHLQKTENESKSVLEDDQRESSAKGDTTVTSHPAAEALPLPSEVSFASCVQTLRASFVFASEPISDWSRLVGFAERMAPMIGIQPDAYNRGASTLGRIPSAITVLCLLQIHERLRSPAAYFNGLVTRARQGDFSLTGMLRMAGKGSQGAGLQV